MVINKRHLMKVLNQLVRIETQDVNIFSTSGNLYFEFQHNGKQVSIILKDTSLNESPLVEILNDEEFMCSN